MTVLELIIRGQHRQIRSSFVAIDSQCYAIESIRGRNWDIGRRKIFAFVNIKLEAYLFIWIKDLIRQSGELYHDMNLTDDPL